MIKHLEVVKPQPEMTEIQGKYETQISRVSQFANWQMQHKNGVAQSIAETYIQRFITHSEINALRKLVVEKLGIPQDEVTKAAAEDLEGILARIQVSYAIIITPDGVITDSGGVV